MATEEIMQTIERLSGEFDDLTIRGLRSAGPQDLAVLRSMREEFERIGADHLAARIASVVQGIENDDRTAAASLMRAQASLRVFERILTLEFAAHALGAMQAESTEDEEGEDE